MYEDMFVTQGRMHTVLFGTPFALEVFCLSKAY